MRRSQRVDRWRRDVEPADVPSVLLDLATADEFAARSLLPIEGITDGVLGFHTQQAVERALKAVLHHVGAGAAGACPGASGRRGRGLGLIHGGSRHGSMPFASRGGGKFGTELPRSRLVASLLASALG
jgi:hypothetical protein